MKKTNVAAAVGRLCKGTAPNTTGVPGEIIDGAGLDLDFLEKKRMHSPYDAPLKALAESGDGKVLKFADPRALNSVRIRAKKMGLRIGFAEAHGALFVRVLGREPVPEKAAAPVAPVASVEAWAQTSRRQRLLEALKAGPASSQRLAGQLRDRGDTAVTMDLAARLLENLEASGDVILRNADNLWVLTAKR